MSRWIRATALVLAGACLAACGSAGSDPTASGNTGNTGAMNQWGEQNLPLLQAVKNDMNKIEAGSSNRDLGQIQTGCDHLQQDLIAVEGAPPIPDATAQKHWSEMLADYEMGANECTNAVSRRDVNLMRQAEDAFNAGYRQHQQLIARIQALGLL